jgi:hypothetical protein
MQEARLHEPGSLDRLRGKPVKSRHPYEVRDRWLRSR